VPVIGGVMLIPLRFSPKIQFFLGMLSRHNIRVKVLQSLYAHLQSENPQAKAAEQYYLRSIDNSYKMYLLCILYLQRIAEYNLKDYEIKTAKHVPTEEDKKASTRLYENPVINALRSNEAYLKTLRKYAVTSLVDTDVVRKLFLEFSKTPYYESYCAMENPPITEHQYALVNLYKKITESEIFNTKMDDLFALWESDQSLVYAAIKRSLRALPTEQHFYQNALPDEGFVHDFGKELLSKCIFYNEDLQALITPRLENWNEDRIAQVDGLLIKMALCELMYFESIPTKVTLDEYVNLAKDYGTDKSRRFVNGILDRLLKDLNEQGRIVKTGRGLQEGEPKAPKAEAEWEDETSLEHDAD
jgi:N utilization substance protein B